MHNRHVRYAGKIIYGESRELDPLKIDLAESDPVRSASLYTRIQTNQHVSGEEEKLRHRKRLIRRKQAQRDDKWRSRDYKEYYNDEGFKTLKQAQNVKVKFSGVPDNIDKGVDSKYGYLHVHSTKELRNVPKEAESRVINKGSNRPTQIIKGEMRASQISFKDSDYFLKTQTVNLSPIRDRYQISPGKLNASRGSLQKLWSEVKMDQVYIKEAQAKQDMINGDLKAQKYINKPDTFNRRMEANNRLGQLVKDPQLGTLPQEDLYNLQKIHSYFCAKKVQRQIKSRGTSKNGRQN